VLSIVDNRTFRRITYEVLDHDPTHADMGRFFRTFHSALDQRGLTLRGTSSGRVLPASVQDVWGGWAEKGHETLCVVRGSTLKRVWPGERLLSPTPSLPLQPRLLETLQRLMQ
jgi:hypothetical protein